MKGDLCEKMSFENIDFINKLVEKNSAERIVTGRIKIIVKETDKGVIKVKISFKEYGPAITTGEKYYVSIDEVIRAKKSIEFTSVDGSSLFLSTKLPIYNRLQSVCYEICREYFN